MIVKTLTNGTKVVIADEAIGKKLKALETYANNHVVDGCWVDSTGTAISVAISTGMVVQGGRIRRVVGIASAAVASHACGMALAYVPWTATGIMRARTAATPTVSAVTASYAGTYPVLPTGAVLLAQIRAYGGTVIGGSAPACINNDARPGMFKMPQNKDWAYFE